jgi:hypothetical protein
MTKDAETPGPLEVTVVEGGEKTPAKSASALPTARQSAAGQGISEDMALSETKMVSAIAALKMPPAAVLRASTRRGR